MESRVFTTHDREALNDALNDARTYRNSKLKELTLIFVGVIVLIYVLGYWEGNFSFGLITEGFLFVLFFGSPVLWFVWYKATRSISEMEDDLKLGLTRMGISKISSINLLNRTIRLEDGTTVYESDPSLDKWKKGDKIFYRKSNSGKHLFECKKVD